MPLFGVHTLGIRTIRKGEEDDKAATGTERGEVK
jgi:hypothetical protein